MPKVQVIWYKEQTAEKSERTRSNYREPEKDTWPLHPFALIVAGWLLLGPFTSNNRPVSLSVSINLYRIIIQQETISAECRPFTCRQYKLQLHSEQFEHVAERGGPGSCIVGSKLNKFEQVQRGGVMLGPCTRIPLLDRQTWLKIIIFGTRLVSAKYDKNAFQ